MVEIFVSPSMKVTVFFPAVKHLESAKSTEEPVPPTLNVMGNLTVPETLAYDTETLFTVHDKEENVVNSSPALKSQVA